MLKEQLEKIIDILKTYPEVKLAYFFGSMAKGEEGPLSDYDFAFYLNEKNREKIFKLKFSLQDKISRLFGKDKVDIVILDMAQSPELKYSILKEGKLFYEVEPYRVAIEPKILNEYFDFHAILSRYGLTKVK